MTNKLSKNELAVMETFWNAGKELSVSDVTEQLKELSPSTIRRTMKGLTKKNIIVVSVINRVEKTHESLYKPVISVSEYIAKEFSDNVKTYGASIESLASAFAHNDTSLTVLEDIIRKAKNNNL